MAGLLYLNHARTSWPKAPEVVDVLRRHADDLGRGDPAVLDSVTGRIAPAREAVARFVGAGDPSRVVFTGSSTEALNLALKGVLGRGDHVVTTVFDHHATSRTLARLERERDVEVTRVAPGDDGLVAPEALAVAVRDATRLLVVTHASNVTGALLDLAAVGRIARGAGVPVLVDAAATAGVVPLHAERDGMAMVAFGAHKRLLGPGGIGALYVHPDVAVEPLRDGNVPGHDADLEQPRVRPRALESGTANLIGIEALGAAVERVAARGWDVIEHGLRPLTARLVGGLRGVEGVTVYAPRSAARQIPIVSFRVDGQAPEETQRRLRDGHGIVVSCGLHNCPYLHRHLGTWPDGVVRMSPGEPTTEADIHRAIAAVRSISAR